MKANEFFKSMGLDGTRKLVKNNNIRNQDTALELKRLIESHELVEKMGGYERVKRVVEQLKLVDWIHVSDRALQAIADVESCQ